MNFSTQQFRKIAASSLAGVFLASILVLSGCSKVSEYFDFTSDADLDLQVPSKTLATKGMEDYNVGKYFTAIEYFEEILDRYPFSPEATLAELKAADCNYQMGRYMEALVLYKEFEERHPTNEAIPYVMFQKGMTHYMRIDRIDRDTSGAVESIKAFNQLLRAYPDSPYSAEAKGRVASAREFLANHEFFVVDFYVRTEEYEQAKKRLGYLLAMYPDSTISGDAQELLAQLEAGEPPERGILHYLPSLSLPDWKLFK